mgnify:CR=1 FL=1
MTEIRTEQPKKIIIGETYMINYIGWKKIKVISISNNKATVQENNGIGEPFKVPVDKIKINLL